MYSDYFSYLLRYNVKQEEKQEQEQQKKEGKVFTLNKRFYCDILFFGEEEREVVRQEHFFPST